MGGRWYSNGFWMNSELWPDEGGMDGGCCEMDSEWTDTCWVGMVDGWWVIVHRNLNGRGVVDGGD